MEATKVAALLCGLLLVAVASETRVASAVTCSPMQLSPCVSAITGSAAPSKQCCTKIKEQKPCLCQYLRNPNLKKFVDSPNARRVANVCKTPYPKC